MITDEIDGLTPKLRKRFLWSDIFVSLAALTILLSSTIYFFVALYEPPVVPVPSSAVAPVVIDSYPTVPERLGVASSTVPSQERPVSGRAAP